jgi:5S rRNA maturation endonuclease (ribonuclease M5)
MKIKINSEYEEIVVVCSKKKGQMKIVFVDENGTRISEQIINDLEIGKEYDIDLDIPNNFEIKKDEIETYEDEVLKEMIRLRDSLGGK